MQFPIEEWLCPIEQSNTWISFEFKLFNSPPKFLNIHFPDELSIVLTPRTHVGHFNWQASTVSTKAIVRTSSRSIQSSRLMVPTRRRPRPAARGIGPRGVGRHVLQQWAVVGTSLDQVSNSHFRRPCAGFHPQAYAQAHPDACVDGGENPLAHWLRAGRPSGRWSRQVFSPLDALVCRSAPARMALHAHFYYLVSAQDLAVRLSRNNTHCDLFLSTDTQAKAAHLRSVFAKHRGMVEIRVTPNRGRDIGPFLTGFACEIENGDYDVFGHVHGKQSLGVDVTMGNLWREFLWENLIGGAHPMLDLAAAIFATRPDVGLLMAEDPHLVGWDENRALAEMLATRMGLPTPLDDFFDFPLGNMFWARPAALRPLLNMRLGWEDYPTEPIAGDGTLVHALERVMPFAAQRVGLGVAGMRAPGTTW